MKVRNLIYLSFHKINFFFWLLVNKCGWHTYLFTIKKNCPTALLVKSLTDISVFQAAVSRIGFALEIKIKANWDIGIYAARLRCFAPLRILF